MNLFATLFSFDGRIGRGGYWLVGLIQMVGGFGLAAVVAAGAANPAHDASVPTGLVLIGALLLAWIGLAASVKRCHDRGRSGFWLFVGILPVIGPMWIVFDLGLLSGSPGENRFGPPPGEGRAARPQSQDEPADRDLDGIVARWRDGGGRRATPSPVVATVAVRSLGERSGRGPVGPVAEFGRRGRR